MQELRWVIWSDKAIAQFAALQGRLGSGMGARRAVMGSNATANDWQVRQTGNVVLSGLGVALGGAGAIEHLTGMKDSRVFVAITRDEDAPNFQIADYGLTDDHFFAVPERTEMIWMRTKAGICR